MKFIPLSEPLYEYIVAHGHNADPLLAELEAETAKLGTISMMQISPEQGTFMSILARATNAKSAIEIGTFTGYSALCIARGLGHDGHLLCCDINSEWTAIARRYWERAGVADRIELRLAPAIETLQALPADRRFDLAFLDADKLSYRAYYETLLPHIRPNGVLIIDNVLWGGAVLDAQPAAQETRALQELNDFIAGDVRVEAVMLPVADGLTIVRKRAPEQ